MRIAVPTDDGTSIAEHFGRSAAFLIFEIEDGRIKGHERKTNGGQHSHGEGSCGHGQPHSHAGILSSLDGCDMVICAGMGRRATEALSSAGITPLIVSARGSAEETVAAYLAGRLTASTESSCGCKH